MGTTMTMATTSLSTEERRELRESVRRLLQKHWPAEDYEHNATDVEAMRKVWLALGELGVTALGGGDAGGLGEVALVAAELGRASCTAPLRDAALTREIFTRASEGNDAVAALLAGLADGTAAVCFSFAGFDGDRLGDGLTLDTGTVSGRLSMLEAAGIATHFVAPAGPDALALVEAGQSEVRIEPVRALGADGLFDVAFTGAAAHVIPLSRAELADLLRFARDYSRVCLASRSAGATRRAFDLVTEYTKERRQFGRAVGSFQAIQHKLVNCLIALDGVELLTEHAAASHDSGDRDFPLYSAAAFATASNDLRRVALETQHTFGAIGYAEEHEAPRHFKRVHVDLLRHGGLPLARRDLAAYYLDGGGRPVPETDLGEVANAFRTEVRQWLEANWDERHRTEFAERPVKAQEIDRGLAQALGETGWLGMTWPKRFGGQERGALENLAFYEMLERFEAPRVGMPVHSAMLIVHGTPEQQERYLPEILAGRGDHGICYSEPGSGSDLASLTTRAEQREDSWVLNGQKIWTTRYFGDYLLVAARTDPDAAPKHAGISLFIVPTDAEGLTIRPSTTMYDGAFANIFFDDVTVPQTALLGGVNKGWTVLTDALATERSLYGGVILMQLVHHFELLCEYLRTTERDGAPLAADPFVRDRMAETAASIEVGRQLMIRSAVTAEEGIAQPHVAAISKVFSGELMERFGEAALDLVGLPAARSRGAAGAVLDGQLEQRLRHSLMWVISLGTNEIQRNLIARKALGLRS
jgi:alkylation response protein AidB-like acyl-CoA dehydrogenase